MQCHAIKCNTMQHRAIPCNTLQNHATPCNTVQYYAIPCNFMLYCAIPCNTIQYHAISCNTMQYCAIPCNTIDRAYLCPVGSLWLFFSCMVFLHFIHLLKFTPQQEGALWFLRSSVILLSVHWRINWDKTTLKMKEMSMSRNSSVQQVKRPFDKQSSRFSKRLPLQLLTIQCFCCIF